MQTGLPRCPARRDDFEVAIICALTCERNAVEAAFDKFWDEDGDRYGRANGDPNHYITGRMGAYNIVLAQLPHMGNSNAASAAASMRSSYVNIRLALVVGVCGGMPHNANGHSVFLGDVIISKSVVQYDFGRQHHNKFVRKDSVEDNLGRANKDIRNLVAVFESDRGLDWVEERSAQLLQKLQQNLPRKRSGNCLEPRAPRFTQSPAAHIGVVASGNLVLRSATHRNKIFQETKAIAFEMEGAGVWDEVPCIVIKGVCDYADSHKHKGWQDYAAATAASVAKAVLERYLQTDKAVQLSSYQGGLHIAHHGSSPQNIHASSGTQNNNTNAGQQSFLGTANVATQEETTGRKTIHQDRREDCLHSLAYAQLGARRHEIEPALAGTCDWLFATPEFREWCRRDRLADHHGVLWLKGKPGAGKSTLMKHALHYCQHHFPDHLIAAYFFHARGDALEKSPLGMLRSIIYELVKHDDTVCRLFVPRYDDKKRLSGGETKAGDRITGLKRLFDWSFSELRDFLIEVIRWQGTQNGGAVRRPLLLLVDALDECSDDGVRTVVKMLETLSGCAAQANVTLRVCLSSRHYPTITIQKHLPLYVDNADGHSQDIAAYISDTLAGDIAELQAEVQRRADGVFLWVMLVVEQLNIAYDDGDIEAMWTTLQSVPDNIEKIFEALVGREGGKREETVLALQWVLLSQRPLFLDELYHAITWATGKKQAAIQQRPTLDDMRRRIISASRGLIEVRKPNSEDLRSDDEQRFQVQFIHLSVNDFLFRQGRLGQLDPTLGPDPVSATHGRIWAICWRYMEQYIARDHNDPLQRRPSAESVTKIQHDYPFLGYTTRYIFAHADKAVARPINIGGAGDAGLAARADLQEALVSWLEKQATGLEWWVGFVRATAGDYETRENVDADLLYILSFGGYSNLSRIVLATEQLRSKTDLNAQVQVGYYGTALCAAAWSGDTETVQTLLAAGADVHLQAQVGHYGTALCAAAAEGEIETVQALIAAGADVHLQAQVGYSGTALCAAAARGSTETVQTLLAAGADVHLQAQVGYYGTALCAAAARGSTETVQTLLAAGADVHLQAQVGYSGTALCAAAAGGSKKIVRILLAAGADVHLQAQVGDYGTALCAAAASGDTETVQTLLAAGADVNLQVQVGYSGTALCAAAARGSTETVQTLLAAGADVHLQAQVGDYGTALCAAQKIGHRDIEQLLLEARARAYSPSLAWTNTPRELRP
ncbi:uncharacterized protein J7T54_005827 [Emericellopsis cladophorae]|uniref:Nucleoside phosphorylase domain-containing protein n=1 Tax=Emericellopsis cladophorae TaxID=2686198 RepID=A0A9Q0BB21_9HYPO|nr:uncharacterized protein J7T54_005827 [Emericellopsis cladophorae]KAI6778040.1 hypothetical protein J7T54_005827 [Emericellopsis cladophorae]